MTEEKKKIFQEFFDEAKSRVKSREPHPTVAAYYMEMIFMLLDRIDELEKKMK